MYYKTITEDDTGKLYRLQLGNTVCQEIFAANKFCGFRGLKGSAKILIHEL